MGIERFNTTVRSEKGEKNIRSIRFSFQEGSADPSLTILSKTEAKYAEKAHDPFHLQNERETNPSQFHLGKRKTLSFSIRFVRRSFSEYLPDENSFFILSPYEIMKAERRDFDDHIDFLISKKKFEEAIQVFEKPARRDAVARRHTQKVRREFQKNTFQSSRCFHFRAFIENLSNF